MVFRMFQILLLRICFVKVVFYIETMVVLLFPLCFMMFIMYLHAFHVYYVIWHVLFFPICILTFTNISIFCIINVL